MGFEGQDFDGIEGVSPSFVESLYRQFAANPVCVAPEWQRWFDGLEGSLSGPTWQRKNWQPAATDGLTAALDPTQMSVAPTTAVATQGTATASGTSVSTAAVDRADGRRVGQQRVRGCSSGRA